MYVRLNTASSSSLRNTISLSNKHSDQKVIIGTKSNLSDLIKVLSEIDNNNFLNE